MYRIVFPIVWSSSFSVNVFSYTEAMAARARRRREWRSPRRFSAQYTCDFSGNWPRDASWLDFLTLDG
jgi:hypothetical protein